MRKVWTAPVVFTGNCRIVGTLDEIGLGKRREPSIATITKLKTWEEWWQLSNDFCSLQELPRKWKHDARVGDQRSSCYCRRHARSSWARRSLGGLRGLWLSLVERLVRDEEAVGSNPTSPIPA